MKCIVLIIILSMSLFSKEESLERQNKFIKETGVNDKKICEKGSNVDEGFYRIEKVGHDKIEIVDYSKVYCKGNLMLYSGSGGSLMKIFIDGKEVFSDPIYELEVVYDVIRIMSKSSFEICPGSSAEYLYYKIKNKKLTQVDKKCVVKEKE